MKAIRLLLLDFHDIDIDDSKPRTEKEKKEMVCLETSGSLVAFNCFSRSQRTFWSY